MTAEMSAVGQVHSSAVSGPVERCQIRRSGDNQRRSRAGAVATIRAVRPGRVDERQHRVAAHDAAGERIHARVPAIADRDRPELDGRALTSGHGQKVVVTPTYSSNASAPLGSTL